MIRRYHELTPKMLDWIRRVEADTIREKNLIYANNAMSDYYKVHYSESWAVAFAETEGRK